MKLNELPVEGWLRVVHVEDISAGLNAIISVHDATLGPACGGCRMYPYATFADALDDAKRLSRGMTFKNSLAGIPFGGGKSVIIGDPRTAKTPELFRAFGRALNELNGLYYTAEDSGVSEHDLETVRQESKWVSGIGPKGKGGNPSPFTARGVFRGIEAAARARFGSGDLKGRSVAIVGVGAVGMALGKHLNEAGARLVVADVNREAVARAVADFGAVAMSPEDAVGAEVDIFAPCALGGAITAQRLKRLKAKVVAGGANNQLATPDMDDAMRASGVLYAPDYVINAGGVISVGLEILGDWDEGDLNRRLDKIGLTLDKLFERAARENRPTGAVADEMAMDVIRNAKKAA
ncbi:MAG: Glu/Leu/Phe/Val dehydrogenase [Parvularculaceae bacterium]